MEIGAKPLELHAVKNKRETSGPLEISPEKDLYGRLLFQGPSFQRLHQFHKLSLEYVECTARIARYNEPGRDEVYILGAPYFRDSILQTGQVVVSRDKALPRSIEQIDIYPMESSCDMAVIIGELIERTEDYWLGAFSVMDRNGTLLQQLTNCKFSILEF